MKTQYETTTKTTVTLNVEDFLSSLNIEESGKLTAVIVQPAYIKVDGLGNTPIPQKISLHFEDIQHREKED